jgi:hypothetical protein
MRRALAAAFLLLPLLPLAGCGLFTSRADRALQKSPDYKAGYQDGCNSAYGPGADKRQDDNTVRDDQAYASNKAYHSGWDRGIRACRSTGYNGGALPGTTNSGPIPDTNPGNGGIPRPY